MSPRTSSEPGVYALVLRLERARTLRVGRLGEVAFERGFHVYVGSALGGLAPRVARHLREQRKPHWHIDYLRAHAEVAGVRVRVTKRRLECALSRELAARAAYTVRGFGSSDCRCAGHLHYFERDPIPLLERMRLCAWA